MLYTTPMTDSAIASIDANGLPYSPALLLDGRFDASITDDPEFRDACESGFDCFLGDRCDDGEVSASHSYTWRGVEEEVVHNIVRRYDIHELAQELLFGPFPPLSWRAGFMLGWLSALASMNASLAWQGVDLLAVLVRTCRTEESERVA